ncbi:MAG: four helix bundle protein [Verrucomicrobia bacterium]|nr:MAG: four helix bundle protein [Verrucomicrobiota bacterium]
MTPEEMCERTMQFALRSMRLAEKLPKSFAGNNAGGQLVRCASSVAANYRATQRARSRADFTNKIGIVLEEADEALFWLELIIRGELLPVERVADLRTEAEELTSVFATMKTTLRSRPR